VLSIVEIDADERIVARLAFDPDDIDAALEELDARYLAGEAAAYSQTWSLTTQAYAALNRRELPPAKADWVNIDHRRAIAFAPGDMTAYIRAGMDLAPDTHTHIASVHRLNSLGAVVTHVLTGTSPDGFDAEWREVCIVMFDGDQISRCEMFDEEDLDAALARFDELQPTGRLLENAASRAHARLKACIEARDWNAVSAILADDITIDDRRRVVNSGIQHGRDAAIADMRGAIDLGLTDISLTVVATRGDRLELCRTCIGGQGGPDPFRMEFVTVYEVNAEHRIVARVGFDLDDIDAAFEELDARYHASEAAPHARTWSVIAEVCTLFNQHELPATTADSVCIDRRPVIAIEAVDLPTYLRGVWETTPHIRIFIEAVHWLSALGAVVTQAVKGTSPEGFNAEWRIVNVFTVEDDRLSRCEVFDESDLDAALARFKELEL